MTPAVRGTKLDMQRMSTRKPGSPCTTCSRHRPHGLHLDVAFTTIVLEGSNVVPKTISLRGRYMLNTLGQLSRTELPQAPAFEAQSKDLTCGPKRSIVRLTRQVISLHRWSRVGRSHLASHNLTRGSVGLHCREVRRDGFQSRSLHREQSRLIQGPMPDDLTRDLVHQQTPLEVRPWQVAIQVREPQFEHHGADVAVLEFHRPCRASGQAIQQPAPVVCLVVALTVQLKREHGQVVGDDERHLVCGPVPATNIFETLHFEAEHLQAPLHGREATRELGRKQATSAGKLVRQGDTRDGLRIGPRAITRIAHEITTGLAEAVALQERRLATCGELVQRRLHGGHAGQVTQLHER